MVFNNIMLLNFTHVGYGSSIKPECWNMGTRGRMFSKTSRYYCSVITNSSIWYKVRSSIYSTYNSRWYSR